MDFDDKLKEIRNIREQKGKEIETLALIDKAEESARNEENYRILVQLNWERSIVWQHVAMNEEAKEHPLPKVITEAVNKMGAYTLEADKIVVANELDDLKPMSYRYLAQVYRYKNEYPKAVAAYEAAIGIFDKLNDVSRLELRGFLAPVMVLQGKTQEGVDLALKTFNDMETDPKALELKQNDYTTWAIWKSGIIPRLVRALHEAQVPYDKDLLEKYLEESRKILVKPVGAVTWGDDKFQFRMDEVAKALTLLGLLIVIHSQSLVDLYLRRY